MDDDYYRTQFVHSNVNQFNAIEGHAHNSNLDRFCAAAYHLYQRFVCEERFAIITLHTRCDVVAKADLSQCFLRCAKIAHSFVHKRRVAATSFHRSTAYVLNAPLNVFFNAMRSPSIRFARRRSETKKMSWDCGAIAE